MAKKEKEKKKKETLRQYMDRKYGHLIQAEDKQVIPTSIQLLNVQLGGGFEVGVPHLVAGHEGSGKSTLVAQFLGKASTLGYDAYFVDKERAMNPTRLQELGCNVDPEEGEPGVTHITGLECLEDLDQWLRDLAYKTIDTEGARDIVVVVDSIAAFPPGSTLERVESKDAGIADVEVAPEARLISKMFKTSVELWAKAGLTIIFVNQLRTKLNINPFARKLDPLRMGQEVSMPGGNAPRFFAHQFLMLEPTSKTITYKYRGQEIEVGKVVNCKTLKNKIIRPMIKIDLTLMYKAGFNDVATLAYLLKAMKFMKIDQGKATLVGYGETVKKKNKEEFELTKFKPAEFVMLWKQEKEFRMACLKHYLAIVDNILNPPLHEEEYKGVEIEEYIDEFEGYKIEETTEDEGMEEGSD